MHGNGGIVSVGSELGICSVKSGVNNAMGMANASNLNNLTGKIKRSNLQTHNNKSLQISQKATVHYVSIFLSSLSLFYGKL